MEDDLVAVSMGLVGQPAKPGQDEFVEVPGADETIDLGAEVISEKVTVNESARLGEEAAIGLEVELANAGRDRLDDLGVGVHLDEVCLHPEKIHDVVEKGSPESAGPVKRTGRAEFAEAFLKVEEIEVRPVEPVDVPDGFGLSKRPGFAVEGFVFAGIEQSAARRMPISRFPALRCDPAKIVPQLEPQVFFGPGAEIAMVDRPGVGMGIAGGGPSIPNFLSTHPLTTRRIEEINKMLLPTDPDQRVARGDYLGRINGMVFGDDPRQGFVEGGAFYNPDLQFMIKIPKGWKYQNSPKQFVMAPDDEKAAVFLSTETSPKDLAEYMKEKLASYKESQVQELRRGALRINGLNAFRGVYDIRPKVQQDQQNQQEQGTPMTVDIHCVRKGGQIFTFLSTTASSTFQGYEPTIDGAIQSFQTLSDPNKLNRRAWRVGLQNGRRGETLKAILQRLKVDQKMWKQHELMNGMSVDMALDTDRAIKFLR